MILLMLKKENYVPIHPARQLPKGKNNSSNNIRYLTYWNGSSSTVLLNSSGGTNGATWYVWRDSGVLSLSDSVGTTQMIASGDTTDWIIVAATGQSVCSCEIVSARRQV